MRKFLIVPDSFKGTLSSKQICEIIKERIAVHFSQAQTITIPVADGGEGSVDCFLSACGGELIECDVVNPFMDCCSMGKPQLLKWQRVRDCRLLKIGKIQCSQRRMGLDYL